MAEHASGVPQIVVSSISVILGWNFGTGTMGFTEELLRGPCYGFKRCNPKKTAYECLTPSGGSLHLLPDKLWHEHKSKSTNKRQRCLNNGPGMFLMVYLAMVLGPVFTVHVSGLGLAGSLDCF